MGTMYCAPKKDPPSKSEDGAPAHSNSSEAKAQWSTHVTSELKLRPPEEGTQKTEDGHSRRARGGMVRQLDSGGGCDDTCAAWWRRARR
jgi:hypothetical protein